MRILAWLLAVALAGVAAYALVSGATPAPALAMRDVWAITVNEENGIVTLAREDFDAIVRVYNQHRAEIIQLRLRSCP